VPEALELAPGDSLAINGVCLTVAAIRDGKAAFDVSPETVRVTTLGDLGEGRLFSLERPLRADARLGGHFVLGHVDATGWLTKLATDVVIAMGGDERSVMVGVPRGVLALTDKSAMIAAGGTHLAWNDDATSASNSR